MCISIPTTKNQKADPMSTFVENGVCFFRLVEVPAIDFL